MQVQKDKMSKKILRVLQCGGKVRKILQMRRVRELLKRKRKKEKDDNFYMLNE
jgi:hypothetical protein